MTKIIKQSSYVAVIAINNMKTLQYNKTKAILW